MYSQFMMHGQKNIKSTVLCLLLHVSVELRHLQGVIHQ